MSKQIDKKDSKNKSTEQKASKKQKNTTPKQAVANDEVKNQIEELNAKALNAQVQQNHKVAESLLSESHAKALESKDSNLIFETSRKKIEFHLGLSKALYSNKPNNEHAKKAAAVADDFINNIKDVSTHIVSLKIIASKLAENGMTHSKACDIYNILIEHHTSANNDDISNKKEIIEHYCAIARLSESDKMSKDEMPYSPKADAYMQALKTIEGIDKKAIAKDPYFLSVVKTLKNELTNPNYKNEKYKGKYDISKMKVVNNFDDNTLAKLVIKEQIENFLKSSYLISGKNGMGEATKILTNYDKNEVIFKNSEIAAVISHINFYLGMSMLNNMVVENKGVMNDKKTPEDNLNSLSLNKFEPAAKNYISKLPPKLGKINFEEKLWFASDEFYKLVSNMIGGYEKTNVNIAHDISNALKKISFDYALIKETKLKDEISDQNQKIEKVINKNSENNPYRLDSDSVLPVIYDVNYSKDKPDIYKALVEIKNSPKLSAEQIEQISNKLYSTVNTLEPLPKLQFSKDNPEHVGEFTKAINQLKCDNLVLSAKSVALHLLMAYPALINKNDSFKNINEKLAAHVEKRADDDQDKLFANLDLVNKPANADKTQSEFENEISIEDIFGNFESKTVEDSQHQASTSGEESSDDDSN